PAQWQAGANITSDNRQPVNGSLNTQYFRDAGGTWSFTVNPVVNLRPSAAVSLQLGPSYVRGFTVAQFITSQDDTAAAATYRARYVFGELSQRQLDLTTRLNLTFSPTDSFQFSNPDSRVRSFRSNAVLRWEYRPGSTLFFVWSQSRSVNLLDPTLDLGHYLGHEMFLDPPTNVLLVKFNYWLSL